MRRTLFNKCLSALAAAGTIVFAGCATQRPLELQCMDRFDIDEFVIGCWSMPPRSKTPGALPDAAYWQTLRDDGFNAVVAADPCGFIAENNLEALIGFARIHPGRDDFPFDLLESLGLKIMLTAVFERVPQVAARHEKIGWHPAVMGYQLCDNCALHDITVDAGWWLKRYAPTKIPWVTYNPSPVTQIQAGLPILTSQNYPFLYNNNGTGPDDGLRASFVVVADYDRLVANRYHGTHWPIISTDGSPSQYRFQQHACAAYGAQGTWLFGYHGYTRIALRDVIRPTHDYLVNIAGPWVLGRRSAEVLHTGPEVPVRHSTPGPGKLIEQMDDYLLAGLLVPDREFSKGNIAPDCIYFVDKRTQKFAQREELKAACWTPDANNTPLPDEAQELLRRMYAEEPEPRAARVTFSDKVRRATALLPDGTMVTYDLSDSREIVLPPLQAGEGILVRIDSAPAKVIRLPEGVVARTIPNPWKFSWAGEGEDKWHLPEFDDGKWKDMNVGYYGKWNWRKGVAWYRTSYTLPQDMQRKHVYLYFGAAEEQAWVFLDGEQKVDHSTGAMKASNRINSTLPFHVELPALSDGKPHTLAVKVFCIHCAGGLYEPVSVVASDEPLDEDQLWMATEPIRQKRVKL